MDKPTDFVRAHLLPSLRRRLRRRVRLHLNALVSSRPRILHLTLAGTEGRNRGDACMCLAIPRIMRRVRPDIHFTLCRMDEVRRDAPIATEVGPCDMVVVGGGGLYGPWYDLTRFSTLRGLGVPIVLYAIGVNLRHGLNELPAKSLRGVRSINEAASLSSVRDAASQRYLHSHGIQAEVICDPVAFYDPVGVNKMKCRTNGPLNVGLNLPYHEPSLREEVDTLGIPVIRELALDFIKRGVKIHYLMHHQAEQNVLRRLQGIPITVHNCGVKRLIRLYHELDMILCSMLHSAIFSFNAEVPFIVIGYDQKHEGFMDLIEARSRYIPLAGLNSDWLRHTTDNVLQGLSTIRGELAVTRKRLWQSHRAFVEAALALLPGTSRGPSRLASGRPSVFSVESE